MSNPKVVECWAIVRDGKLTRRYGDEWIVSPTPETARGCLPDETVERYFLVPAAEWERVNARSSLLDHLALKTRILLRQLCRSYEDCVTDGRIAEFRRELDENIPERTVEVS